MIDKPGQKAQNAPINPEAAPMRAVLQLIVAGSFCWFIASSLWVYPHSLSFFNESIGGPLNGPKHLLGSNLDWGQDELYVLATTSKHEVIRITSDFSPPNHEEQESQVCVLGLLSNRISAVNSDRRKRLLALFQDGVPLNYTKRIIDCRLVGFPDSEEE